MSSREGGVSRAPGRAGRAPPGPPATPVLAWLGGSVGAAMRFEELPPSLLERLGLRDEADVAWQRVLFEVSELRRVSMNTSLSQAGKVAWDVVAPPSPVFLLLSVWVVLLAARCMVVRASAARQVRRHAKLL